MKLHAINTARLILHRVQSVVSKCCHMKTRRHFRDVIAVTHPNIQLRRQTLKQSTRHVQHFQSRITKLTIWRRSHLSSELARKDLEPIADPERWTIDRFEQLR